MKKAPIVCFFVLFSLMVLATAANADPPPGLVPTGNQDTLASEQTAQIISDCCDDLEICNDSLTSCRNDLEVLEGDLDYLNRTFLEKEDVIEKQRSGTYGFFQFLDLKVDIFVKTVTVYYFIFNLIISLIVSLKLNLIVKTVMKLKIKDKQLREYTVKRLLEINKIKEISEMIDNLGRLGHTIFNILQLIFAFFIIFGLLLLPV